MASWIRGKLLGAGAFGSVNLAMNREDGAVFAAKSVVADANSQFALKAIENEITILQSLESEFVVECRGSDWTEESGQLVRNLFLEYMPEGCLTDFVNQFSRSAVLDEHLVRTYTRSVVQGIEYLHRNGIVHCDIKGKNILVGNGNVKLTDFGSAKRVDCDASVSVSGTPLWMAPEVVRQVEQGPASDIWSLGCTVVELATGREPWSNLAGMNQLVALYHIGCTDALPAVPEWLSPDAKDFLSHCFQRDPRKRWTSAQLLEHPFLTTRFVPEKTPVPSSPSSVLDQLPCEDCINSVPTLATPPSFFRRKLFVEAPAQEQWWSSPDSGPWIVVRSPKSSACTTPTSQSCASQELVETSVAEACIDEVVVEACHDDELEVEELHCDEVTIEQVSTSFSEECSEEFLAAKWMPREIFSAKRIADFLSDGYVKPSDSGLDSSARDDRNVIVQYSNPQICLHWWHNRWFQPHCWNSYGLSDHCMLHPFKFYTSEIDQHLHRVIVCLSVCLSESLLLYMYLSLCDTVVHISTNSGHGQYYFSSQKEVFFGSQYLLH